MRTLVTCFLWSCSVILAQTPSIIVPVYFPAQLKTYLALSDDQINRINMTREQAFTVQQPKVIRQNELQIEIAEETAKPVPNPAVLGPRYAELELIRRDLEVLQKNLVAQTQAILGADQKTKLLALQQALNLNSTACDAIGQNLLNSPPPSVLVGGILGIAPGNRINAVLGLPYPFQQASCGSTITPVIRSGDFSAGAVTTSR